MSVTKRLWLSSSDAAGLGASGWGASGLAGACLGGSGWAAWGALGGGGAAAAHMGEGPGEGVLVDGVPGFRGCAALGGLGFGRLRLGGGRAWGAPAGRPGGPWAGWRRRRSCGRRPWRRRPGPACPRLLGRAGLGRTGGLGRGGGAGLGGGGVFPRRRDSRRAPPSDGPGFRSGWAACSARQRDTAPGRPASPGCPGGRVVSPMEGNWLTLLSKEVPSSGTPSHRCRPGRRG